MVFGFFMLANFEYFCFAVLCNSKVYILLLSFSQCLGSHTTLHIIRQCKTFNQPFEKGLKQLCCFAVNRSSAFIWHSLRKCFNEFWVILANLQQTDMQFVSDSENVHVEMLSSLYKNEKKNNKKFTIYVLYSFVRINIWLWQTLYKCLN